MRRLDYRAFQAGIFRRLPVRTAMDQIAEIAVTYPDAETARAAADSLVDARLAACAHVEGPVHSTYRWEGKVQREPEWRLTAKTRTELAERVVQALAASHPYELPGFVIHTPHTNPAFASWVKAETREGG